MQPIVAKICINVKLIFLPAPGDYYIFYMMTFYGSKNDWRKII